MKTQKYSPFKWGWIIALVLISGLVLFGTARADVTGWKTAGAIVASGSWSNFTLNQINTSNNARATVATINSYGVCSNYQFNIPTGSTINGLEVRVEGSSSTTGTVNYAVQLSWDLGITWTAAKTNSFTGTTDANQTLGGTADTWARSWTAAELSNPLFQFRIYKTGGANLRVDLIQIQVHFTPPLVSLADHLAGQKENAFLNAGLLSGAELLAFQLTNNSGSIINLTQVLFQLSTISGINQGDLSNLLIYVDENANGVVDGGETAMVGGSGSVDSGVTAITFSSPFTLAANSVTYFILKGDVANLNANDRLAIRLESTGLTVSGGTAGGSTEAVNHQLYDFLYRRPVTVNAPQRGAACGTSYSLAHFPVLISLSGDWLKTIGNGGRIQHGSGYDILFKAADGRTKLDHELEAYDGTAGTLLAWVRVPALFQNNQDTLIYVYYGSATMAAPTENPAGVWSDGYSGIWHLAQDPGPGGQGDITDSTRFGNHGTAEASMSSGNLVDGKIGRGIRFDGVDDGIWFPDPHDGGSLTLSAWINASALNNSWHTVAQRDNSNNSWFDWQLYARADDAPTPLHATFRVDLDNDGTYTEQAQSDIALATDTWYFLTATYDGSDFKFYRDGVLTDTYLQTGSFPDSNRAMWLGRNAIWNEPFQGIIDEFRVSTVARDDCWVGTEFNNQNAPGNFLTPGNEETGPFLTGTVYEDRNYGGGSGRSLSESQGTGRPNVRVELYDGSGNYLTATTTNGSGVYTFSSLAAGTYIVRVVNNTVGSGRSGGCVSPPTGCSQIPVQVFGTNAISGIAIPVTDHVGGEVPGKADAGNGSTTLTDLNTPTTTAQSITTVTFSTTDVLGIDFGFNFNTVVNTNDTGQGSLRQFLTNANALSNAGLNQAGRTAGIDNAVFMLADGTARPGMNIGYGSMFSGGVATISPASVLPAVMDPIIIDGTTQPTWVNSPIIELNGSGAGASWVGLCLLGGNSTVKGLVINRFSTGVGIYIGAVGDNQILGNYIGTNAAGTAAASNGTGIQVDDVGPTTIGGDSPGAGNLISGNSGSGIEVSGSASTGLRVMGNKIGINFAGSAFIPNGGHGVFISDTGPVQNTIGGTAAGAGNLIAGNTGNGVTITGTTSGNALLGNSLYGNGGLGIDLNNDNITLNDAGDPDTGGNGLQNFPVLTNASTGGGLLTLAGFLQSMANTGFRIEFFANSSPDPGGYGEGERYLGATNVTTDGAGNTVIALTLVASVAAGEFISSTATRLDAGLQPVETSEFSLSVAATAGTLTVTNTNDTINGDTSSVATLIASPGADGISLREAITAANNTLGTDTILFNISGGGVKTIAPASALPSIDDPVVIDGYSQPGASVNTLAQGSNATLLIVINGASAGGSTFGLIINAGSSTIRGLVINDFSYAGLALNARKRKSDPGKLRRYQCRRDSRRS